MIPAILIIIGVVLIGLNIKIIKEEKKDFKAFVEKEYDNMTPSKLMEGELRQVLAEDILELQKEIMALNEKIEDLSKEESLSEPLKEHIIEDKKEATKPLPLKEENPVEKENEEIKELLKDNMTQREKIKAMVREGRDIEDICKELKVGKGEVLLVKDLYKN